MHADWARPIWPEDGSTVEIDFFKPDEIQVFTWEVRENSTYKISFDVNMHFENPYVFEMGTADSLKITNQDLLEVLRTVWPDFSSIKRFFWEVEQNTNGTIRNSWRNFNAMLAIESFTDPRDNERYDAQQFIVNDGSLITIMAENLRACFYSDSTEFAIPYKTAGTEDDVFNYQVGNYYSWETASRVSWDEVKAATLNNEYVQGVCPNGWHLPSYDEIVKLREHIGMWDGALYVKDPTYWLTTTGVTNSAKLGIMGSGYFWNEDSDEPSNSYFSDYPVTGLWTATPYLKGLELAWGNIPLDDDKNMAVVMTMYDDAENITLQGYGIVPGGENRHYPVRCIMNDIE
ncbi:MAG: fibrobacter succinogenes major paralogous domain-containing protein [Tannerellaceae bacterium]|nr:fibrobacter succinogenes major paralogous domain-containing protein [Tannerellaceae bacterium]